MIRLAALLLLTSCAHHPPVVIAPDCEVMLVDAEGEPLGCLR